MSKYQNVKLLFKNNLVIIKYTIYVLNSTLIPIVKLKVGINVMCHYLVDQVNMPTLG